MTFDEFKANCLADADRIFVRHQFPHGWSNASLAELPAPVRDNWINRWWEEKREPIAIKEPDEP